MKHLASVLLILCAGCAPFAAPTTSYRDVSAPISSSTRFEEKRFAGQWFVIADFIGPSLPQVREVFGQPSWTFEARPGPDFGVAKARMMPAMPQPYRETAAGQFAPDSYMMRNQPPLWVLWIDEDFQTAVIGTPSGSFGAILNRAPKLRADRLQAAREILDFNGYDLSQLRMIPQG